jgi:hypothetical protein
MRNEQTPPIRAIPEGVTLSYAIYRGCDLRLRALTGAAGHFGRDSAASRAGKSPW